ncbi:MAG: LamG domain-containing protein, partial [Bacteroidetes bacterium]|nr:LamG domain-containing protein [Bacteroidota bacterium]
MKIKLLFLTVWMTSYLPAQNNMLNYSANGDAITYGGSTTVAGNYTVEVWFNTSSIDLDRQIFTAKSLTNSTAAFYLSIGTGTSVSFTTTEGTQTASATFGANEWHHLACAVSPTRYTLYLDGNMIASRTMADSTTLFAPTQEIHIGGWGNWFLGYLDEIRVWNVTRTNSEIQTNMLNSLTGTEPGLISYYNCNELSGTTLHNIVSSEMHCTLSGSVGFTSIAFPATAVFKGYTSNVATTSAVLNGSYYSNNNASSCYFEYGTTQSYGTTSTVQN